MTQKYADTTENIDVQYVANLARLELTSEETEQFQTQLDQVLHYMNQLDELDVEGVAPTAHAVSISNVFREDEQKQPLDREQALANAPEKEDGNFIVPKVVG